MLILSKIPLFQGVSKLLEGSACKYKCMNKHYYFFLFVMFTLSRFLNVLVLKETKLNLFDHTVKTEIFNTLQCVMC